MGIERNLDVRNDEKKQKKTPHAICTDYDKNKLDILNFIHNLKVHKYMTSKENQFLQDIFTKHSGSH